MNYIRLVFDIEEEAIKDIFIARLSEYGVAGFEDQGQQLLCYVDEAGFVEKDISDFAALHHILYTKDIIEETNWNEKWENEFHPVIVGDFCTVRAHFHDLNVSTKHDIVITPKMSFGTGHHATTQLMIKQMEYLPFDDAHVVDFGTGTGVLAILAKRLGAKDVFAIDNDTWSIENTIENISRNNCNDITACLGSLENLESTNYDVILANINRNILLEYMQQMHQALKPGGYLLMSGLLREDRQIIVETANNTGFLLTKEEELNNWIVLLFQRI